MNKEKIIKGASEILGISDDDKHLSSCLEIKLNEYYCYELSDEQWIYGLVAEYAFCAGMFDEWKEYQKKFNKSLFGVVK